MPCIVYEELGLDHIFTIFFFSLHFFSLRFFVAVAERGAVED